MINAGFYSHLSSVIYDVLNELFRVTKTTGFIIIMSSWKMDETYIDECFIPLIKRMEIKFEYYNIKKTKILIISMEKFNSD